jgi:hypothetical protein
VAHAAPTWTARALRAFTYDVKVRDYPFLNLLRSPLLFTLLEEDEDFSWKYEEEDSSATTVPASHLATSVPSAPDSAELHEAKKASPPSMASTMQDLAAPFVLSTRHSSEGSYDATSSNASISGDAEQERKAAVEEESEDGSDWE